MLRKYWGDWSSVEELNASFDGERWGCRDRKGTQFVLDSEVLFAAYTYENYSGAALVVFERDGQVFEVNGGHCSCYDLEGQWEPEETTWGALAMRKLPDWAFSSDMIAAFNALVESRKTQVC